MRVFIAGAAGVIGRRAVRRLVAAGHAVTAVTRSQEGREALEREGAATVNVDLFDFRAVPRVVEGHEAVVNLATHIPRGRLRLFFPRAWSETDRLRVEASGILSDAAIATKARVFVQESYALTYPDFGSEWVHEELQLLPTRYNQTVSDAEASAARFAFAGGRGVSLRFAAFYGPADPFTEQVLNSVKHGIFPIIGRADGYFSMVHHDDAASAVLTALDAPSGAYNVVDDEPMTRRELGDAMADLLDVRHPRLLPKWLASLTGPVGQTMSRSIRLSNRKLRGAGWSPAYPSVREGLRAIVGARRAGPQPYVPVQTEGHART